MPDYRKLYSILFNSITDALELLEQGNLETAKAILITALSVATAVVQDLDTDD